MFSYSNSVLGENGDEGAKLSTRRTDALYLEAMLRQQKKEDARRDLDYEHSFQPELTAKWA